MHIFSRYKTVMEIITPRVLRAIWEDASPMNRWDASNAVVLLSAHLRESDKGDCILIPLVSRISSESSDEIRSVITETFGRLSSSLGHSLTSRFVVAQLSALSEDPSPKVRRASVLAIREVMRTESSESRLIPIFQRLCTDTSVAVRQACIEVFADILSVIHNVEVVNEFLNIYISFAKQDTSLVVRKNAIANSGSILALPCTTDISSFLELYLTTDQGPQKHHAKFFTGVVTRIGPLYWNTGLNECFQRLATNCDDGNRRIIACAISYLMKSLGPNISNSDDFFPHVLALLSDPVVTVSCPAVHAVADMYPLLTENHRLKILTCMSRESERSWRYREAVALMLGSLLQAIMSSSTLSFPGEYLIPIWKNLLVDRAACVRAPAIRCSAYIVSSLCIDWANPTRDCVKLMSDLVDNFSRSRYSFERQTFIQIAVDCFQSRAIPLEVSECVFLKPLMHLAHDSAASVRTTWAREVAPLLRFPGGRWAHHKELVILAHQLLLDLDKEVVRLISRVTFSPLDELTGATPPPPLPQIEQTVVDRIRRFLHDIEMENHSQASSSVESKHHVPQDAATDVTVSAGS